MAWYDVGTVSVTNGSTTVTGSGTDFISGVQVGEGLYIGGDLYEIATIVSGTELTLADAYLGSTATGQDYKIIPTQSLVADLSSGVANLISDFADVRDYAGNGKFNDGSVSSPAITFTQDQNNGLYRIGSDNWGLVAGGEKIVDVSTNGIKLDDNNKATFGTGDDLQIYHDGSHSRIVDTGTGNLKIQAQNFAVNNVTDTENMITAEPDGFVKLFYNGAEKLATTSTGVDVTGTVTADGVKAGNSSGYEIITDTTTEASWTHVAATGSSTLNVGRNSSWGGDFTIQTDTKDRMRFDHNGNVSFYEDTGTTAKMVWDASAENLNITGQKDSTSLTLSAPLVTVGGGTLADYNQIYFDNTSGDGDAYIRHLSNAHSDSKSALTFGTSETGTVTERMRIDSSGNLLVNTTSPQNAKFKVGTGAYYNYVHGSADSVEAWIGSENSGAGTESSLVVGRGHYGGSGNESASLKLIPSHGNEGFNSGFSISSDRVNLGTTHAELNFKRALRGTSSTLDDTTVAKLNVNGNLWLNDGINLGGTGTANRLDDYEEGVFTPTVFGTTTAGVGTYSTQSGRYTKVGNKVHIEIVLAWSAHTGSGGMRINGLPFNTNGVRQTFEMTTENMTYTGIPKVLNFGNNNSVLQLFSQSSATGLSLISIDTFVSYMVITGSYETNY